MVTLGSRRVDHLQTADKQQAVRPSSSGRRKQIDDQITQADRQDQRYHARTRDQRADDQRQPRRERPSHDADHSHHDGKQ
jgi:hypothetical protein